MINKNHLLLVKKHPYRGLQNYRNAQDCGWENPYISYSDWYVCYVVRGAKVCMNVEVLWYVLWYAI